MKKQLLALAVVVTGFCTALTAFGQGQVQFDNLGTIVNAPIYNYDGAPVQPSDNFTVELWGAFGYDRPWYSLSFLGVTTVIVSDGYFLAGTVTTPLPANTPVTLQVRAWDTDTGCCYDIAIIRGESTLMNYLTGPIPNPVPGQPPIPAGEMPMSSFGTWLIPEPGTLALAGLGLASLLVLRRRK